MIILIYKNKIQNLINKKYKLMNQIWMKNIIHLQKVQNRIILQEIVVKLIVKMLLKIKFLNKLMILHKYKIKMITIINKIYIKNLVV